MRPTNLLSLALGIVATAAPLSIASAQFGAPSYNADKTFANGAPNQHTMGIAFDGASYWSVDGGGPGGVRLAQYNSSGAFLTSYSPGLDFRSVFTDAAGNVFARQYSDNTIYSMSAPGVFAAAVSLVGGSLDAQSSVVLNGAGTEYVAMNLGNVDRWDLTGAYLGSVSLSGFGSMGSEGAYPSNRGIAAFGADYLTYDGGGDLSMWDASGNRVGTTVLVGAGTSFDSDFSFSGASDGRVLIADGVRGNWRGYQVADASVPVTGTPEPATVSLMATGLVGLVGVARRRKASAKV